MPDKPYLHGRDHRPGGADPIPDLSTGLVQFPYTCRLTCTVAADEIAPNALFHPDYSAGDSLFKSSDGGDFVFQERAFPYTGNHFHYDEFDGPGFATLHYLRVYGPGLFLAESWWYFGSTIDTINSAYAAQLEMEGNRWYAGADDDDQPLVLLEGNVIAADGGTISALVQSCAYRRVDTYPTGTTGLLATPQTVQAHHLFGIRTASDWIDVRTLVMHSYRNGGGTNVAIPRATYFGMNVVRLGDFDAITGVDSEGVVGEIDGGAP